MVILSRVLKKLYKEPPLNAFLFTKNLKNVEYILMNKDYFL